MSGQAGDDDEAVQQWRVRKMIKSLANARGNGTSMISLIVKPGDQVAKVNKMLSDEYGTASNIKSRVNRLSVLSAITSTQQRLKLYNKIPPNGLVIFCGTVVNEEGKEKMVNKDFEPFKPINTSLYLCDNRFHTEPLNELLESSDKFGFIVMDGNGTLFGTLCGSHRSVLHTFQVSLPKKHGRGGQSAMRFARLRLEKRHNYVRKVAELAVQFFIGADNQVNCTGLVLAGSADFKSELAGSALFDPRLVAKIITYVDVSYGGESGFNQAIERAGEVLGNVKFVQEKKLLQSYFDEVTQDTGKYCFGVKDTMNALEQGAVKTLIVWENLQCSRFRVRNNTTGKEDVLYLTPQQAKDATHFHDKETGVELENLEEESLVEWFAENYKSFGTKLEFVTNRSEEGAQFSRGFGGVGGVLRYAVDFQAMEYHSSDFDSDDSSSYSEGDI